MGIYVGRGFDFFTSEGGILTYKLRLENIEPDFKAVHISIQNRADIISSYWIKQNNTIYIKQGTAPQLRVVFRGVQLDRLEKPMANFSFYSDRAYNWLLA